TYEPIQPEVVGNKRVFIFGKHTGTAAVEDRLKEAGVKASHGEVRGIVAEIKALAEGKGKEDQTAFIEMYREREERLRGVTEEEFWVIAEKVGLLPPEET
ncbi:MAG: hypothetical protein V3U30_01995, partial [Thermoplasmata archaeon]